MARIIPVLLVVGVALGLLSFEGKAAPALVLCMPIAAVAYLLIRGGTDDDKVFLTRVFLGGLLVRLVVGTLIYVFEAQVFFGGDATAYDSIGYMQLKVLQGEDYYRRFVNNSVHGWGMLYYVASIYAVTGRNMLAVQYVNSVLGAATGPVIYLCARHIMQNRSVARIAAVLIAFYPSLVLWSSQGLKDGPIVFLLALSMLAVLKLGDRLSMKYLVALVIGLLGILSLRFYVFYMLAVAAVGAFIIGMRRVTGQSLARQVMTVAFVGLSLTYFGVVRTADRQLDYFANLERIQNARSDLARSANSGFGRDVDVSTTSGAITAIPIGMMYLLFAPFPWQLANLRQSITLPEMLVWWASFPLLVLGGWFTIRYRLRQALPILLFTSMLTLAYSLLQGNVGTAYRQRAQLLVFYFIFVAVGVVLLKERREDRARQAEAARRGAEESARALHGARRAGAQALAAGEEEWSGAGRAAGERADV